MGEKEKEVEIEAYFEFLFEQRSADVGWIMQLSGAIVIEDLSEHARVTIEEILVEYWIVVGQGSGQFGESGGRYLLESMLIGLVSHATDVEYDSVLGVHGR